MNWIKQWRRKNRMLKANKNILEFIQRRSETTLSMYKEQREKDGVDIGRIELEALVLEYSVLSDYILKELDNV